MGELGVSALKLRLPPMIIAIGSRVRIVSAIIFLFLDINFTEGSNRLGEY